jgi:transposase InsO family protein
MAGARIAWHFGRPGTPNDQAWIESFFGHLKGEHPHLDKIADSGELEAELGRLRATYYNTVRLHEGLGYVTPDDEHHGRGEAIRAARPAGLKAAQQARVATRRAMREDHP